MTSEERLTNIEKRLSSIEIEHTRVEERAKSNTKRLDEAEVELKENGSLITAIKELAVETKYMREDLNKTIQRLDKLENREGDKWDKFKWLIVAGIITIILGYVAMGVGLK